MYERRIARSAPQGAPPPQVHAHASHTRRIRCSCSASPVESSPSPVSACCASHPRLLSLPLPPSLRHQPSWLPVTGQEDAIPDARAQLRALEERVAQLREEALRNYLDQVGTVRCRGCSCGRTVEPQK